MSLVKEFRDFVAKGNVLDLAVAVVIGTAFTAIVNATVEGLIMPIVGLILPGDTWADFMLGPLAIGRVLAALIDFLIIALVLFIVVKKVMGRVMKKEKPVEAGPILKECPECTEMIPIKAKRCKWCASVQPV